MRIPDFMLRCVAFLGYEDAAGQVWYGGTGVLLRVDVDDALVALRYLLTARHNITGIPSKPGSGLKHQLEPFAEFTNLNGEAFHVSLAEADWIFPDDDAVDLAICYFPSENPMSLAIGAHTLLGGSDDLARKGIGIGDETYSVSLYGFRQKALSKTPIARIGNISMLPLEKALTEFGETEMYLIEPRSLSGFSGAPVFVRETVSLPEQQRPNGETFKPNALGYLYLLGLLHGHSEPGPEDRGINTGLAYVVPSERIKDLLASESFLAKMETHVAHALERRRERHAAERTIADAASELISED